MKLTDTELPAKLLMRNERVKGKGLPATGRGFKGRCRYGSSVEELINTKRRRFT